MEWKQFEQHGRNGTVTRSRREHEAERVASLRACRRGEVEAEIESQRASLFTMHGIRGWRRNSDLVGERDLMARLEYLQSVVTVK